MKYEEPDQCLPISNAKEFVQGLVDEFGSQISSKNIQGILDAHTSDSLTIPSVPPYSPENGFIQNAPGGSKDLPEFFSNVANSGFERLTTESVVQEGCVLHEIGLISPPNIRYYNRWEKEGGKYKIKFENLLFQPPKQESTTSLYN